MHFRLQRVLLYYTKASNYHAQRSDKATQMNVKNVLSLFGVCGKKEKAISKLHGSIMIIILIFSIRTINSDLMETPKNRAVLIGNERVVFKCKSDEGFKLKWWMQPSTISERQLLFDGYSISRDAESFCHVVNEKPGEFNINLESKYEAAQTYICQEPPTSSEYSADLIILNKARFEKNVSDDLVFIKCIVEFWGNWPPELEWSHNGASIVHGVFPSTVSNSMVSSTLVIPTSSIDRNYTCTTKFDIRSKPKNTTSAIVPEYRSSSDHKVEAYKQNSNEYEGQSGVSTVLMVGLTVTAIIFCAVIVAIPYSKHRKRKRSPKKVKETSTENSTDPIVLL